MTEELETIDSTNDEIEVIDSEDNETEVVEDEEEEYTPREKQLYARLKKTEAELKAKKTAPEAQTPASNSNLSTSDLLAVMNANVHEDDMERVEKFAKMEGISIKESLKNPDLKAILDRRAEERTTASATNVTNTRRGSTKVSDEVIVANASKGRLPEDDEGIERLIAAKRKLK